MIDLHVLDMHRQLHHENHDKDVRVLACNGCNGLPHALAECRRDTELLLQISQENPLRFSETGVIASMRRKCADDGIEDFQDTLKVLTGVDTVIEKNFKITRK
ncbi:MAG: hypothetical protein WCG83_05475 [Candidatus Peregrinibacteria bacterium]